MTPREEAKALLDLCKHDLLEAMRVLERQLTVVQDRAQLLMSLAGVVVTVTGFSGRNISNTSMFGKVTIVSGLAVVLLSVVWVWIRVMRLRWITYTLDREPVAALEQMIVHRQRKTRAYQRGGLILCVGLFLYGMAVAQMLLSP